MIAILKNPGEEPTEVEFDGSEDDLTRLVGGPAALVKSFSDGIDVWACSEAEAFGLPKNTDKNYTTYGVILLTGPSSQGAAARWSLDHDGRKGRAINWAKRNAVEGNG